MLTCEWVAAPNDSCGNHVHSKPAVCISWHCWLQERMPYRTRKRS